MTETPAHDKSDEVRFLIQNFNMPPVRAAELVADGPEAEELASRVLLEERESDPLDVVPTPDPDADREHLEPDIGDLEKPVVRSEAAKT